MCSAFCNAVSGSDTIRSCFLAITSLAWRRPTVPGVSSKNNCTSSSVKTASMFCVVVSILLLTEETEARTS
ncbi:unnamed protein product [Haemonchus placei]|uniref:Secreted protein n=1 Tax=Haemonchus placei TaxID=6290 RepID=A0A0N4X420_HAEPC|nr:unnamed protein product [Haemonchus placei]